MARSGVPPPNENGLIPRERIQAYCDAIAREFRPRKIFLFGSYAYGQPTPYSDVDLLVVMPFRGNDVVKTIEIRSRFDTPFPLDLIVRKPEFIVRRESRAGYVHRTAHDRGPSHVPIARRSAIQPQVIVGGLNPKFARHTLRQNPVQQTRRPAQVDE